MKSLLTHLAILAGAFYLLFFLPSFALLVFLAFFVSFFFVPFILILIVMSLLRRILRQSQLFHQFFQDIFLIDSFLRAIGWFSFYFDVFWVEKAVYFKLAREVGGYLQRWGEYWWENPLVNLPEINGVSNLHGFPRLQFLSNLFLCSELHPQFVHVGYDCDTECHFEIGVFETLRSYFFNEILNFLILVTILKDSLAHRA